MVRMNTCTKWLVKLQSHKLCHGQKHLIKNTPLKIQTSDKQECTYVTKYARIVVHK